MVRLQMSPALLGSRLTLGPAPWFRVERNELRQGPTESLVGELQDHQWNVRGRRFSMVEANPGTTIQFAGPSGPVMPAYGPYTEVRMADGAFYGDGQLIARFDEETYLWRCTETHKAYAAVLVSSTPSS